MKNLFKLITHNLSLITILLIVNCSLLIVNCFGQFDFIGRKINPNLLKPIPSSLVKSGNTIPSLDFKFDSIRPLTELKTGKGEFYPWFSPDGNRIYYTEGLNPSQIYMAEKQPGQYKFTNPHPLFNGIDTLIKWTAWLTNDELNIYFIGTSDHLVHSKRNSINQDFSTPVRVKLNGIGNIIYSLAGPSLTQDSNQLYLGNQSNGISKPIYGICVFNKTAVNEYTFSDTLQIPNNYSSGVGTLTSDYLNYFLNIEFEQFVRIYLFKKDSVNEQFTKLYYINNPYINDSNYLSIGCPYFSISNNILAFVKADSGFDNAPLIYLAYNFRQFDNIKENNNISNYLKIYPNPTDNYVELLSAKPQQSFYYYLIDLSGQIIKSGSFIGNTSLDVSILTKGVYILKLIDKNSQQITFNKVLKI